MISLEQVVPFVEKHWTIISSVGSALVLRLIWPRIIKPTIESVAGLASLPARFSAIEHGQVAMTAKIDSAAGKIDQLSYVMTNDGRTGLVQVVSMLSARQRLTMKDRCIWDAAASGDVVRVSPGVHRLTGWEQEDIIGSGWVRLIPDDGAEDFFAAWENAIKNRLAFSYPRQGSRPFVCADGKTIQGRMTAVPTLVAKTDDALWACEIEEMRDE